ncbi:Os09g0415550 [Oryza sativa Japonica Group]|uniref:Os09g0415550 protein n=1 Tax=Oryza sativa subsp. japonica TaxID=39947 RepID=A0A0P0XMY1_ORYSJ|nr:Os09g0415550 [Oryza sativa Japonica Group]
MREDLMDGSIHRCRRSVGPADDRVCGLWTVPPCAGEELRVVLGPRMVGCTMARSVCCRGGRLGGACSRGRERGGAVVAAGRLRIVVAAGLRVVLRAIVAGGLRVVVAPTPPYRHRLEVGGAECVDGDGVVQAEGRLVVVVAAPLQIPEGRGKTMGCAISLRTTVTAEPEGLRVVVAGRTTATALGG